MIDYRSAFGYVPNITFTLEQHLKNYSEIELNARRLLESFHIIRDKMEKNLRPVIALFPHYSEHSHEHSEHIISAIEKMLGRKRIETLSPADTWMLLVCAYMHDLGMLVQGKELASDWMTPEFQNHIQNCMHSYDDELKKAALNVSSVDWINKSFGWPVHIYRDVILLASEFYRRKHPERAKILPQREELKQALNSTMSGDGKIPQRIQEIVGKICFSHGISFSEMITLLEPMDSLLVYEFHPRFIAALLCLGDLCDLDNGRFNLMAIEVFGGLTKSNLVHYYKHESVTSFVIQKDMISVTFDIQNRKIKDELKKNKRAAFADKDLQDFCDSILLETQNWISWMADIIKNIKLYWNELCVSNMEPFTPSLFYKILVEGKETISSKKNMRFSFSNEKAYELIEGYNLYNNRFTFVRELLQNSVDALKKQFWMDILSGRWNHLLKHLENDGRIDYKKIQPYDFSETYVFDCYQIKILVEHYDKDQFAKFVIEDNGTGISKDDVEKRIIDTGVHNDPNNGIIDEMPEWLKPTSAFGIGLHSVFAVTNTLFAQTCTEFDRTVYNINMHSGKLDGYVFMSVAEQQGLKFCNCSHGTRMEFAVNVSDCIQDEVASEEHDYDPLVERPESNFCRMLQKMLTSMLGVSLFHITYKFNCDNEINYTKLYEDRYMGLLFRSNRRNNVFEKKYSNDYYDFAIEMSGEHIILWDKQRAISMVYSLEDSGFSVFCKGFKVENAKINTSGYNMVPKIVDYWGGDTKKLLNICRDSLSHEQMENNKAIFSQARTYMADVYYSVLSSLLTDNDIKKWHNDISEFMKPWLAKKMDDKELPNLSEIVITFLDKYNMLMFGKDDIKSMLLRHGFCLLLKSCKEQIKGVLNSLDENEKIKYVLDFELINEENSINKSIKEQTYLFEFIDAAFEAFDNENDQMYIYRLFRGIFKAEYADIFINRSEHELYRINDNYDFCGFEKTFGAVYTSVLADISAYSFIKSRHRYIECSKKDEEGYMPRPLDIYLSIPLTKIVYLLICTATDVSPLKTALISELSYIPGYDNSYGFIGVNNVSELIMSTQLRIEIEKFNDMLAEYFPFMRWLSCKSISINLDGKLVLHFNNEYEKKGVIEFQDDSFTKLLHSHSHIKEFPVPAEYKDIAVNQTAALSVSSKDYDEELWFYSNYATYLWDDFNNIRKRYGPRLAADEDKETIIDEIMPNSRTDNKPTLNLLRFIYHNKVYNNDLPFEDAWEKIYETYRRFVSMVLDCISIPVKSEPQQPSLNV